MSDFIDPLGEASLLSKAKVLDEYLAGVFAENWTAASARLRIQTAEENKTKNLWGFFLLASAAIIKATKNKSTADGAAELLAHRFCTLADVASPRGGLGLLVVADHPSIKEDLSTAWHPALEGAKLQAAEAITSQELSQIESALGLIEVASTRATSLVNEVCAAICLLRVTGKMDPGSCISLTSKFVPGLIYFTPAPVIMTSESIVHEAAHLWLSRFESSEDLYIEPDRRVASPLRLDPRPLRGLTHQTWVLSNLLPFYRDLSRLDLPVIAANSEKLAKRLAQHAADLEVGLAIVRDNKDAFTDRGRDFVESLSSSGIQTWR